MRTEVVKAVSNQQERTHSYRIFRNTGTYFRQYEYCNLPGRRIPELRPENQECRHPAIGLRSGKYTIFSGGRKSHRKINRFTRACVRPRAKWQQPQEHERFMVEIYKKFSIPFASIVLLWSALPLGIVARRGSLGMGATLSIIFSWFTGSSWSWRRSGWPRIAHPFLGMWFQHTARNRRGYLLAYRQETTIMKGEYCSENQGRIRKRRILR